MMVRASNAQGHILRADTGMGRIAIWSWFGAEPAIVQPPIALKAAGIPSLPVGPP